MKKIACGSHLGSPGIVPLETGKFVVKIQCNNCGGNMAASTLGVNFIKPGRPRKQIDMDAAIDLLHRGEKVPAIAEELGISPITLRKRIKELSSQQGLLLKYRELQNLQLTSIQAQILESITPDKINSAPLRDLVAAFKILKDKELVVDGKPSEIKGIVAHLVHLEKVEAAANNAGEFNDDLLEAEFSDEENEENEEDEAPRDIFEVLEELDESDF